MYRNIVHYGFKFTTHIQHIYNTQEGPRSLVPQDLRCSKVVKVDLAASLKDLHAD